MVEIGGRQYPPPLLHFSDVFALDGECCFLCNEIAVDAWERMQFAGMNIRPGSDNRVEIGRDVVMRIGRWI